jgi:hypothetical protein
VREVERVDFLLVAFECVPDAFAGDVPYLCGRKWKGYQSATRNRRKWRRTRITRSSAPVARYFPSGEADRADVQVPLLGNVFVDKRAAERASTHAVEQNGCMFRRGET